MYFASDDWTVRTWVFRAARTIGAVAVTTDKTWTEYSVRCRRWIRGPGGKKIWETVNLGAANAEQALYFYDDIKSKPSALERPQLIVRTVTERRVKPSELRE